MQSSLFELRTIPIQFSGSDLSMQEPAHVDLPTLVELLV